MFSFLKSSSLLLHELFHLGQSNNAEALKKFNIFFWLVGVFCLLYRSYERRRHFMPLVKHWQFTKGCCTVFFLSSSACKRRSAQITIFFVQLMSKKIKNTRPERIWETQAVHRGYQCSNIFPPSLSHSFSCSVKNLIRKKGGIRSFSLERMLCLLRRSALLWDSFRQSESRPANHRDIRRKTRFFPCNNNNLSQRFMKKASERSESAILLWRRGTRGRRNNDGKSISGCLHVAGISSLALPSCHWISRRHKSLLKGENSTRRNTFFSIFMSSQQLLIKDSGYRRLIFRSAHGTALSRGIEHALSASNQDSHGEDWSDAHSYVFALFISAKAKIRDES